MRTNIALAALVFAIAHPAVAADPDANAASVGAGRDPFASFGSDEPVSPACEERPGVVCHRLDELVLRAVVTGTASPRAMFEDKAGKSHLIRVGDTVGGMRVKALRKDTVVLEEAFRRYDGYVIKRDVSATLR